MPKKEKENAIQTHKDDLKQQIATQESHLTQRQTDETTMNVRIFKRKKILQYHNLEQTQLREVNIMLYIR